MSNFDDKLAARLRQTMGSELDPELATPMAAGPDEDPQMEEHLPISRQFRDTNMGGRYSRNTYGIRGSRKKED